MRRLHFVGIGGMGMSGIAEIALDLGYPVSGSDLKLTELTRRLGSAGAEIREGHRARAVLGAGTVVVSSAVPPSNPEVRCARRLGIPVMSRAGMLAEMARLKKTVTVAGSHGKTTTASMTAMALRAAGADPTIIIGGRLKNLGSNARLGAGGYLVAEADESDGSFLELEPLVAIVTNVDDDHLDHYKTMANLKTAFLRHIKSVPAGGAAVLCADDPVARSLARKARAFFSRGAGRSVVTYGLEPGADWGAAGIKLGAGRSRFTLLRRGRPIGRASLRVSGRHNVLNCLAAVAAGAHLGFPLGKMLSGLARFKGVGRRMDVLGSAGGVLFMDDYGHHPTEIKATLEAVGSLYAKGRRLIVVFQPHRYSRTKLLERAFGPAFKRAGRVYVMEIYPAGEKPIRGVTSRLLLDSMRRGGVDARPFAGARDLARELRRGDVVLTLGAGDVRGVGETLFRRFRGNG